MKFISIPTHLPHEVKVIDIEKIVSFVYDEKINHTLNIELTGGQHVMVNGKFAEKLYSYLMVFDETLALDHDWKPKSTTIDEKGNIS
jgi:hypothetical protein